MKLYRELQLTMTPLDFYYLCLSGYFTDPRNMQNLAAPPAPHKEGE
jgi:hypothetical protein